ncbi:hypothetical protein ACSEVU_25970 [Pseudomonas aeruginosa]
MEMNKAMELLRGLVSEIERQTCEHAETHRGGAIWEICDSCGAKWADDEGGKPEFEWPESVEKAREFLAAHPTVEQAGGDERAAFELFVRKHCGMPEHIAVNWDAKFTNDAWEGWQARAALAQPSPAQADEKPGDSILCYGCFAKGVGPDHFDEAGKCLAAQAEQEAERPEVVAWRYGSSGGILSDKACLDEWKSGGEYQSLMTVAQHERIVVALRAEIAEWQEAAGRGRSDVVAYIAERAKLLEGRDAALARVAELEAKLSDPTAVHQWQFSNAWFDGSEEVVLKAGKEGSPIRTLYTAPPAQAQQLHDLDKQCRDDVARALGLRPSQERGFAWSYLLASIKSCVKASEDAAQAQHSVPELLVRAEGFVSGFEDDDEQEGVSQLLADLRLAIGRAK